MRSLYSIGLFALAACSGGDPTTTDAVEPTEPDEQAVMRDCQPELGRICPWAGAGINGYNGDEVHRLDAWFSFPMSVTFSPHGAPILADWNNHKLRMVNDTPEAGFRTIMGTDFLGDGDPDLNDATPAGAPGTTVNLNHPTMQVYFSDGVLLSASWHTHKLRTWDPQTELVHVYLGGAPGFNGPELGEPADDTQLNQVKEVRLDPLDENFVYILDMRNQRIRRLDRETWTVDTIAGDGTKGYCGEGDALTTCFNFPQNANPEPGGSMALTADGSTMYIADSESHVIRKLDLVNGTIELFSGTPGTSGFADGAAADALWNYPTSFAIDHDTNELFVADANNHRVRVIDLDSGEVSTFAGTGEPSCELENLLIPVVCDNQSAGGDGGLATEATLYRPFGVDLDPEGNLVIADTYNQRFRIVYR